MDDTCFTMLCWFLQHESATSIPVSPPSRFSLPTPLHPTRLSQSAELSSLCYTTASHWPSVLHMVIYIFQCYSLSSSHPLLLLCPQIWSLYLPLFLPCRVVHQYHFSRFHVYTLIYTIFVFLFLTYFIPYNRLMVHPPQFSWLKFVPFYGWVVFHCILVP